MNDVEARIATLLNEHVDAALGPRRPAPPLRTTPTLELVRPARWRRVLPPLAAACIIAAVVAIAALVVHRTARHAPPAVPQTNGWQRVTLPGGAGLYNEPRVGLSDLRHGWIVGSVQGPRHTVADVVWTTSDAGRSWTAHLPKLAGRGSIVNAAFGDAEHGWLLRRHAGRYEVYATTDGGAIWSLQTTLAWEPAGITVVDARHGWIYGPGGLIATVDGASWRPLSTPIAAGRLQFVDPLHGWLEGPSRGRTYGTADGGHTWQQLPNPGRRALGASLDFVSPTQGWALTPHHLLVTTDGGRSWHDRLTVGGRSYLTVPSFSDALHGWVFGSIGGHPAALRTADGGQTWTRQDLPAGWVLHAASRSCVTVAVTTTRAFRNVGCGS